MVIERCSISVNGLECKLPPSNIVSIISGNEEYMIGLVCSDHINLMRAKVLSMQKSGKIGSGKIGFQRIKQVMTECILNQNDVDHDFRCLEE